MGINIKIARIKKGLKQAELCEMANISAGTLRKLENGKTDPKRSVMLRVAEALGEPVNELFF